MRRTCHCRHSRNRNHRRSCRTGTGCSRCTQFRRPSCRRRLQPCRRFQRDNRHRSHRMSCTRSPTRKRDCQGRIRRLLACTCRCCTCLVVCRSSPSAAIARWSGSCRSLARTRCSARCTAHSTHPCSYPRTLLRFRRSQRVQCGERPSPACTCRSHTTRRAPRTRDHNSVRRGRMRVPQRTRQMLGRSVPPSLCTIRRNRKCPDNAQRDRPGW
jgi:hypothetical protein